MASAVQIQRESWSRSMDQMTSEMGSRMCEVDRLRAEANSLLQAARADASSAAKDEFHGLSSRIDDIHRQSLQQRENVQVIKLLGNLINRHCWVSAHSFAPLSLCGLA